MCWKILFLFASFHVLSTVKDSSLRIPDNFTCYNSSDPAALNASLLYNDLSDIGELWNRDDLQKPLPFCSDIWNLLSYHTCVVCRDKQVFAVCQSLSESADLRMEDSSRAIRISRCACDQLDNKAEIPTTAPTPAETQLHWSIPTAVSIIILPAVVSISVYCFRKRKSKDKQDPEAAFKTFLKGGELTDGVKIQKIQNLCV
ncbi:uncharacterized protein LOC112136642 [Oryzias melastigma]|uniref:uncharacterized protein LOC112136642 n=1 Tax=Oryzias melastigma TaxID=30732 RepID=UPI000CF7B3AF|nr:uncharacterized protein LOC112136642 [Oryzias melastigma]XP_024114266.1 uncharacterized protein LOC112136642 [Oryzias melastigma]